MPVPMHTSSPYVIDSTDNDDKVCADLVRIFTPASTTTQHTLTYDLLRAAFDTLHATADNQVEGKIQDPSKCSRFLYLGMFRRATPEKASDIQEAEARHLRFTARREAIAVLAMGDYPEDVRRMLQSTIESYGGSSTAGDTQTEESQ